MDILMPKVGLTMTEGTIVQWHKHEGDRVQRGDLLFTFETEKSTLEFESPQAGVLARIVAPAGQMTPCLALVAEMEEGERPEARGQKTEDRGKKPEARGQKPEDRRQRQEARGQRPEARSQRQEAGSEKQEVPSQSQRQEAGDGIESVGPGVPVTDATVSASDSHVTSENRPVSPRARLRARELNINLNRVPGSGPNGVVLERDILAYQPSQVGETRRSKTTPVAERVAMELGVDLASVHGSGPDGRITRADIERAAALISNLQSPISNLQSLSSARRITAQRTAESARTVPHVTITTEADATALVSAREQLNAELNDKVSYNALLIAIAARALKEHPQMNASWTENGIAFHSAINIGVAVDTPRGLYVPVVHDAQRPLIQIHRDLAGLVERTLSGHLNGDEFSSGTFTITNLGMYEIDFFTPIINLPQAAILGVGRILGKPVARGEQVVVRQMMALSLSFDHRVVDGAPAAKFLQRIKALIERPFALLV